MHAHGVHKPGLTCARHTVGQLADPAGRVPPNGEAHGVKNGGLPEASTPMHRLMSDMAILCIESSRSCSIADRLHRASPTSYTMLSSIEYSPLFSLATLPIRARCTGGPPGGAY